MDMETLETFVNAYQSFHRDNGDDDDLRRIGKSFDEQSVSQYLNFAISYYSQPHIVLKAILEAIPQESLNIITQVIKDSILAIAKWKFGSKEKTDMYTTAFRNKVPKLLSPKKRVSLLNKITIKVQKLDPKTENYAFIEESLISILSSLLDLLHNDNSTIAVNKDDETKDVSCREFCNLYIKDLIENSPNHLFPYLIDLFKEVPMTDENLDLMIESINNNSLENLSTITSKIFLPISNNKKLVSKCMNLIITTALLIEKDKQGYDREIQEHLRNLIKSLYMVTSMSRLCSDSITTILCSKTELASHFTPFIVSLSLYTSRIRPKIYDALVANFGQQLKDDQIRTTSRYLRHIYNLFSEDVSEFNVESVIKETILLTHHGLESNIRFLSNFAFQLIDSAPPMDASKRLPSKIKESYSKFVTPAYRQVDIATKILNQIVTTFPFACKEIFKEIVLRITNKLSNSDALIRCLDSPDEPQLVAEMLVEIIEQMRYLDLMTLEQLMRFAIPKIVGNEQLLDRVVIASRKAFFSGTESMKVNGLAAIFYLIQPRYEQTFTQAFTSNTAFGSRIDAATSNDLLFQMFSLIERGFRQEPRVQADTAMFIPLLIQLNSDLADSARLMYIEQLDEYTTGEEFPLSIKPNLPYLIQSIGDTISSLPPAIAKTEEWESLIKRFDDLVEAVSKVELVVYTEEMKVLTHPLERDIIAATLAVMFNYAIRNDEQMALSLFNTLDRLNHKIAESERLRKDTALRSSYTFRFSINVDLLKTLFKLLQGDNQEITKHYGIQLYTLERCREIIKEIPCLRLEYRIKRLRLALDLGEMTIDAIDKVKWCEPPSGLKNPQNLMEMLTDNFKKLFIFVFETYDRQTVERFLEQSHILTPGKGIGSAQRSLFSSFKGFINGNEAKCAENYVVILEKLAMFDDSDAKFFESITKMLSKQIIKNAQSYKIIRLARAFSPGAKLDWLKSAADSVVERLADEAGTTSAPLHEIISCVTGLSSDVSFGLSWIPKAYAANHERGSEISSEFSQYLTDIGAIGAKLMEVDYSQFNMKYYEEIVKFIKDYVKVINKLIKQTLDIPETASESLNELLSFSTSTFGDVAAKFLLKSQSSTEAAKNARQAEFDAKHAPLLIFELEKMLVGTSKLISKKCIEDISGEFCRIRGAEVKVMHTQRKKKKKVERIEEEPEQEPEQPQEQTEDSAPEMNESTHNDEEEEEENLIRNAQIPLNEEEDEDEDSVVDL